MTEGITWQNSYSVPGSWGLFPTKRHPAPAEPDYSPHKWHPAGAVVDFSPKNGILLQQ
ncbi:MAG: hypothetical protein AB7S69_02615 [Salinivirgaceae bacterium]